MRPLHVLEVDVGWPPEAYLRRTFDGLVDAGMRVSATAESVPRGRRCDGIRVIRLPSRAEPKLAAALWCLRDAIVLAVRRPVRLVSLVRAALQLRLLRRVLPVVLARPDVVHFEWNSPAITMLPAYEAFGVPVVVSLRGEIHYRPQVRAERAGAYPALFARAAAVHCVSEALKREAVRQGLDPAKARVIRPAVDTESFTPGSRQADGTFRVIGVGDLHWVKGYDDALAAIARLVAEGLPVSYEILGGEPAPASGKASDRPRVQYLIHDHGLGAHVTLRGSVSQDEVRERLRASDVLLHASLSEGLPNAVLEAMSCGLPVVVTDAGGVPEAVTDGVEGLVRPRRSSERLAEALMSLARDPALARRLGGAGRARVCADFALPQQVEAFVRLYEEVTASRGGR